MRLPSSVQVGPSLAYSKIARPELKFPPIPEIPDEFLAPQDRELTPTDYRRMVGIEAGDPVGLDYGNLAAQKETLAQEKAARRLGVLGLEGVTGEAALGIILAAERTKDVVRHTELETADALSRLVGCEVLLKREDLQKPIHSFKLRGAANMITRAVAIDRPLGVYAPSAGNHGQGVAYSGMLANLPVKIFLPATAPDPKVEAIRSFGAEINLFGNSFSDAFNHMQQMQTDNGWLYVPPFNNKDVIDGGGTVAKEIVDDRPDTSIYFIPVGGGGLIAGMAQYIKARSPRVRVIGVQSQDSNAMEQSVAAGKIVTLDHVGTFSDGTAVKEVGPLTFSVVQEQVDDIITVSEEELCLAIADTHHETRVYPEPAGALSVAGAKKYAKTHDMSGEVAACVISGANIAPEKLSNVLRQLKIASGKEALFSVTLPEEAGALRKFCQQIDGHNIAEFHYRANGSPEGKILIGFSVAGAQDKVQLASKLEASEWPSRDYSNDPFAKQHLRSMVGGKSAGSNERIYEINFPERPGALTSFLNVLEDRWNISLFDYTAQGGDTGTVVVGFAINESAIDAASLDDLEQLLKKQEYEFAPVTSDAIKEFL